MKRGLVILLMALAFAPAAHATPAAKSAPEAAAPKGRAAVAGRDAPRRLEDIHIEGQMPAPQVLFITARDQRRFLDFQHRRYLRSVRAIGEDARLPRRLVTPRPEPATGGER